jgi:hypothetical protein
MAARSLACDPVQRYVSLGYRSYRQCRAGLHNRAANGAHEGMRRQIRERRGRRIAGRLVWMKETNEGQSGRGREKRQIGHTAIELAVEES